MRNAHVLALTTLLACASISAAQAPIGPFLADHYEGFEVHTPGVHSGLSIFDATSDLMGGSIAVNANPLVLPAHSGSKSAFGDGADIAFSFNGCVKKFGAYFRAAKSTVGSFRLDFYSWAGVYKGSVITALSGKSWQWKGWTLPDAWMTQRIEVVAISLTPGYVAVDSARMTWL